MSKGPWKHTTKLKHANKRAPVKPLTIEAEPVTETPKPKSDIPPPLPPIGGVAEHPAGEPASPGSAGAVFDESKIKGGLGKAFCGLTKGFGILLNGFMKNSRYEIEFDAIEPELGDLWAEFAFPVLKMHLPDLEKNPHMVLAVMTCVILSGKVRVKVKEAKPNVGTVNGTESTANSDTALDRGVPGVQ